MKKILKNSSVDSKTDFLSVYRDAPDNLKKQSSLQDLMKRVGDARKRKAEERF